MKVLKIENKFVMEDNGNVVELMPNKDYYVKLPENSCNRVWVSCAKVDKAPNQCIDYGDVVKTPRVLGPRTSESKKLIDYATDEERAIIEEILQRCKERKAADRPAPMSELEKAQRKLERDQRRVDELLAAQNA
jgi:hypothetical protein